MSKRTAIILGVAGVILIPLVTVLIFTGGRFFRASEPKGVDQEGYAELPSGLKIKDVKIGDGFEVKPGGKAIVFYTGKLMDGRKFDSNIGTNGFTVNLGEGAVIRGWEEGLVGMKIGGRRKLIIPPELGYGARGSPPAIPPNATLYFEIELINVE